MLKLVQNMTGGRKYFTKCTSFIVGTKMMSSLAFIKDQ